MIVEPVSIEVVIEAGLIVRGYEWPVRGAPVVLLHDYDADLDSWQGLDRELAESGFRVINLELRGHGLSDGEPDFSQVFSDTKALLDEIKQVWGPIGLCSYGKVAAILCALVDDRAPPVQVAISPRTNVDGDLVLKHATRPDTAYLVISGTVDAENSKQARLLFDQLGKNKLWASVASQRRGPELLREHHHLMGDITLFLQRYLVPIHLKWQEAALEQAISETQPADSEVKK